MKGEEVVQGCRRCGVRLKPDDPLRGFCSDSHRRASRRLAAALIVAGPGCTRCYRGAVFFEWRPSGGRQRSGIPNMEGSRFAECWCSAGRNLRGLVKMEHKAWGFMLDYNLEGVREIAPRRSPLDRVDKHNEMPSD